MLVSDPVICGWISKRKEFEREIKEIERRKGSRRRKRREQRRIEQTRKWRRKRGHFIRKECKLKANGRRKKMMIPESTPSTFSFAFSFLLLSSFLSSSFLIPFPY